VDYLYSKVFEKLRDNMSDAADVDVLQLYCAGTCKVLTFSKILIII